MSKFQLKRTCGCISTAISVFQAPTKQQHRTRPPPTPFRYEGWRFKCIQRSYRIRKILIEGSVSKFQLKRTCGWFPRPISVIQGPTNQRHHSRPPTAQFRYRGDPLRLPQVACSNRNTSVEGVVSKFHTKRTCGSIFTPISANSSDFRHPIQMWQCSSPHQHQDHPLRLPHYPF